MKRFYAIFVAMLMGATSLLAQTNYKVTFSANVAMHSRKCKDRKKISEKIYVSVKP